MAEAFAAETPALSDQAVTAAQAVATKGFDILPALHPAAQVVGMTGIVAAVLLMMWVLAARLRPPAVATASPAVQDDNQDVIALARAIAALADEQGRSVHNLAGAVERVEAAVEKMADMITGCATCAFNPTRRNT